MTPSSPRFENTTQAAKTWHWGLRWSRLVTLIVLVNLLFSLFNLSYVSLRPIYFHYLPAIAHTYDPVKGIEPHPVTQDYLRSIRELRTQISQWGLQDQATATVLQQLRDKSTALIEENPFEGKHQAATFSQLKRRIRQETNTYSAQAGFQNFWQSSFIRLSGWSAVDQFLRKYIEPLLAQNYYREFLPTGQPIDEFWRLDLYFIAFFAAEFLIRTLILSRYTPDVNWLDTLARRWYEIPLLVPFWRWLRIIPATVRTHRSQLVNVEKLLGQITHEPAAYLSERVSKYLIVRLINEAQAFVRDGSISKVWQEQSAYTTIGKAQKVDLITDRLVHLIVMRVMPSVKPDIEDLLRHSLQRALAESEVYDGVRQIPGFETLPDEALKGIAGYLAEATCEVLSSSYTDAEGRVLLDQLSSDFRQSLSQELQNKADSSELKKLFSDVLEEFKVNYVQRSRQQPPESTLQEVNTLHHGT
ncbi:MAG: hypothetical protein ACFBSG_01170 [Leptolyngbyaceae cyanobacterium]